MVKTNLLNSMSLFSTPVDTTNQPECGPTQVSHHNHSTTEWAIRRLRATTTPSHLGRCSCRPPVRTPAGSIPSPSSTHDIEARFICLTAGRLGFPAGEIAYFQMAWINWDRQTIRIPQHEPCKCGYCRGQTRQESTNTDNKSVEDAVDFLWYPKTGLSSAYPVRPLASTGTV